MKHISLWSGNCVSASILTKMHIHPFYFTSTIHALSCCWWFLPTLGPLGYERVYTRLCEVADTPFHIGRDVMVWNNIIRSMQICCRSRSHKLGYIPTDSYLWKEIQFHEKQIYTLFYLSNRWLQTPSDPSDYSGAMRISKNCLLCLFLDQYDHTVSL